MKIALIGQDIPTLLPGLLTDLLFAGRAEADLTAEDGWIAKDWDINGQEASLAIRRA